MNQVTKKQIKVATSFRTKGKYFKKETVIVPKIILHGNYLERADFNPSNLIEVIVKKGKIVIKKIPI